MELTYKVNSSSNYINVRQVLKNEFNMSNRLITKLKQNKYIFLNNEETFLDKQINLNDIIKCNLDFNEISENIVATKMDLNILYEDNCFLIVDKPHNMAVHPSILHYENSLSNGVQYYFNKINLNTKIRPVNRLDRDTTGIVIFAKNEYIQECLVKQMKSNKFYKEYIAILEGIVEPKKGIINAASFRKPNSIIERCIDNKKRKYSYYQI